MLRFKKTEFADAEIIRRFTRSEEELSCENNFVNMLVWQDVYRNMWACEDGQLIIKSGWGERTVYRLPYGDDFEKGMAMILAHNGGEMPDFWAPDGERFRLFSSRYADRYQIKENRDAFDYLYLQSDLAALAGKKYHSKRNHIHAFEKRFAWEFCPITEENTDQVLRCAEKWYAENEDRLDRYMRCEATGIRTMLENREALGISGGVIFADSQVVAFTMGSPVNSEVFDIHIEKALADYAECYTLINREFAKTLSAYRYINREDDMGLEGLRKAKLSYHPALLLPKHFCKAKEKA